MTTQEFLTIIRRNFLVPVVIAVYALACILLLLGEYRDAWFVAVVISINVIIGVVQEIRARYALKKLELMSAPRARRLLPDGATEDILYSQLAVGDQIQLMAGDELPADGELLTSQGLEVDESILTGESVAIEKPRGATVLASSVVVAGTATARVTAVGDATAAGRMTAKLRTYDPELTPLQRHIATAITMLTYGAIGLSILVAAVYLLHGMDVVSIFKTITSGAVAIIPEGLLLASTLFLAYGSLRLAAAKVLPQKLSAIEAMAMLNVLCTDKTGTLTEPEVTFQAYEPLVDDQVEYHRQLIGIAAEQTGPGNSTGEAIMAGFPAPSDHHVSQVLAFSSERKLSGVTARYAGYQPTTIIMGAPEFVGRYAPLNQTQQQRVAALAGEGKRVLLAAILTPGTDDIKAALNPGAAFTPIGLIILANGLRPGVVDTVRYLQAQGVSIRVISGDNPATVSAIAQQAGVANPHATMTGQQLAELPEAQWAQAVADTTIFARVLPEQKERLIATLQAGGAFVGMVGDGVNDALALKKADLGVAMFSGAAASRRVADLVLLNNSFNALPVGMRLGNRIMQAIEIIATLFFHKITYAIVLLLLTMALGLVYPFQPRHNTFLNMFLVTFPTIMWTLLPPLPRHRVMPQYFWRDCVRAVLPIAALSGAAVAASYWFLTHTAGSGHQTGIATTTVLIAACFGMYMVFLVPRMFPLVIQRPARVAQALYVLASVATFTAIFSVPWVRSFFDFTRPVLPGGFQVILLGAGLLATMVTQWYLARRAGHSIAARHTKG